MDRLELEALLQHAKTGTPPLAWNRDTNHAGSEFQTFGLVCAERRGLVVEFVARDNDRNGRRRIDFTLLDSDPIFRRADRIFQLSVDDARFIAHRFPDGTDLYGSHERFGDETIARPDLNRAPFAHVLDEFLARLSITLDGDVEDPFREFKLQ